MVQEKVIIALLIIAMLLSVVSIVVTLSLNLNSTNNQELSGKNYGEVRLIVNPNPEAGPEDNSEV